MLAGAENQAVRFSRILLMNGDYSAGNLRCGKQQKELTLLRFRHLRCGLAFRGDVNLLPDRVVEFVASVLRGAERDVDREIDDALPFVEVEPGARIDFDAIAAQFRLNRRAGIARLRVKDVIDLHHPCQIVELLFRRERPVDHPDCCRFSISGRRFRPNRQVAGVEGHRRRRGGAADAVTAFRALHRHVAAGSDDRHKIILHAIPPELEKLRFKLEFLSTRASFPPLPRDRGNRRSRTV